jgi:twitching motility protein PilU
MSRSNEQGMQTFDQHLYEMYAGGQITYEDAIAHADSANDLRLMIKLGADSDPNALNDGLAGLAIEDEKESDRGRSMGR